MINTNTEEIKKQFMELKIANRNKIIRFLQEFKMSYIMYGTKVDVPYFFWSTNKHIFQDDEHIKFLEIKTSREFTISVLYLLIRATPNN